MTRAVLVVAAVMVTLAVNAPAGNAGDLLSELKVCRALGKAERVDCYDAVVARHSTDAKVAAAAPAATPPAPVAAAAPAAPPPARPLSPLDSFGSETLTGKAAEDAGKPEQVDEIDSVVTALTRSPSGRVILSLENGQVWRQIAGDSERYRGRVGDRIRIARGFLGSYNLSIEGINQTIKVRREK